ncbi:MAG: hypothetical protein KBA60_03565 [Flavobacteriales bacterium]|nr:hypothetical protein [Flavobacteriales bacterium]
MTTRLLLWVPGVFSFFFAQAQINTGGRPLSFDAAALTITPIPKIDFLRPAVDPAERNIDERGVPRYGEQIFQAIDMLAQGHWDMLEDGSSVCRLVLRSSGAAMLSVQFDAWEPGEGTTVFLYREDRTFSIGAFGQSNRTPSGTMATQVVPGEAVVIEYHVPDGVGLGQLHVASITHVYTNIFAPRASEEQGTERDIDPGYQSSPCHINANCPEAAAWQDQKRATVMFLRPDGGGCSGSLLNNTATPGKPYLDIAEHCLYAPTLDDYVFYFNYETAGCVGNVGPTTQTMTGATYRSSWSLDDFALIELNAPIPAAYNAYYAGWDRSGNVPQTITAYEHPLYDVKKIAFEQDPPTSTVIANINMWRVFWDQGMLEPGASGGPAYDQNKRFIGHLSDGQQNCATITTAPSGVAKMSAMWDQEYSFYRLRDWLDPANTTVTLDGYDPNTSGDQEVMVKLKAFLEGPYNSTNGKMDANLRTAGYIPLMEPYTGLGYPHVGGGGELVAQSVLNNSNSTTAVVDWVVVELRDKLDPTTVVSTRSALILRNGKVVDKDGVSDVAFSMPADQYYVALRHRNHLGVMTAGSTALSATATLLDLSIGTAPVYGGSVAMKPMAGKAALWAGDVRGNGDVSYTGENNDRDAILNLIGGNVATTVMNGYYEADTNMDGIVSYTGDMNDRDVILVNIGGTVATNTRTGTLP